MQLFLHRTSRQAARKVHRRRDIGMQARNWGWSRAKKLHKVKFLLYKICVPAILLGVPVQNYDDGVIRRVRTNLQNFVNSVNSVNPGWVCLPSSDCVPDTSLSFLVEFYIPWLCPAFAQMSKTFNQELRRQG